MYLKTEKCVICGEKAECWHGFVKAKERMALGNYIEKHVIAGFCQTHENCDSKTGDYGDYDNSKMGKCIQLF